MLKALLIPLTLACGAGLIYGIRRLWQNYLQDKMEDSESSILLCYLLYLFGALLVIPIHSFFKWILKWLLE